MTSRDFCDYFSLLGKLPVRWSFQLIPANHKPDNRFGLDAIKGVGRGAAEEIIRARESGGQFKDLEDFLERVDMHIVGKKAFEALIKCGALDGLRKRTAE